MEPYVFSLCTSYYVFTLILISPSRGERTAAGVWIPAQGRNDIWKGDPTGRPYGLEPDVFVLAAGALFFSAGEGFEGFYEEGAGVSWVYELLTPLALV